jgi:hypothetical protein
MQFWNKGKSRDVSKAVKAITDKLKLKYSTANLYEWYYNTLACFQKGGIAWTRWNREFQDELINAQAGDGSWPSTGGDKSWHGAGGGGYAPVYRTSLCTLMLEVYYRYLPTN